MGGREETNSKWSGVEWSGSSQGLAMVMAMANGWRVSTFGMEWQRETERVS